MIYPTTTCHWCSVQLRWTSRYDFVNYAFEYFQRENNVPLEYLARAYYKPKSSTRWNLCRACYKLNLTNIHRREITGRCKLDNHRGVDITDMVGIFMLKLFNQTWRHKRYIEFMWYKNHTFDAFLDYIYVRDHLLYTDHDEDEIYYYYEDMVRSHFEVPTRFEATRDYDDNIINFHLNGTGTIVVNAHPVVE